jgi:hypothetical protein
MQEEELSKDTQSFIVRIWNDPASNSARSKTWRGSIIHVGSGKRVYFHDLNSVKRFIEEQTGMRRGPVLEAVKTFLGKGRPKSTG